MSTVDQVKKEHKMKRISFLLVFTALMVFSFGLAHGATEIVLDNVTGLWAIDTVEIDVPVGCTFRLTYTPGNGTVLLAFTNGFQVYTKLSDANPTTPGYFDAPVLDTLPIGPSGWFYHSVYNPGGHFDDLMFQQFSLDGLGRDTTTVSAVWTTGNAPGFADGYSEQVWYIATEAHTNGDTLCIDSSFFPPGGAWLWSLSAGTPPTLSPDWYGPHCFHVYDPTAPPPNDPPELSPIGPQEVTESLLLNFDVIATDPDGTTPLLSTSTLPGTATFTDNGGGMGTFNWIPGFFDAGIYRITFYATDEIDPALIDSEQVEITVIDSNRIPVVVIPSGQDQDVNEGEMLVFTALATDSDSTTPLLEAHLYGEDTLATNMVFVDSLNGVGVLTFSPDFTQGDDDPTLYVVAFRATDETDPSLSVESAPYTLQVYNVNQAPVVDPINDFPICEGDSVEVPANAQDPDGDMLTMWVEPLVPNMDFNDLGNGSGLLKFAPVPGQAGDYPTTLFASDGKDTSSVAFVITVVDCSGIDEGQAVIRPDFMYAFYQYAITPMMDTTYLGNFMGGHSVEYIDLASVRVNTTIAITSANVLDSFPGFSGKVLEIISPITPFLEGYGAFYDTSVHEFTVTGLFDDGAVFTATGEVVLRGHLSGDVNLDGHVDIGDLTYLVSYLFRGGEEPAIMNLGDVDGNCDVNVADITFLVRYLHHGGPRPHCDCRR